ncbi:MAG: hypothetical protein GY842_02890 [bacterium]|nr:hypothetical protein [bacterium]
MGKLIKVVVLLGAIVVGIVYAVQYADKSAAPDAEARQPQAEDKDAIQVQERYGFAPIGGD